MPVRAQTQDQAPLENVADPGAGQTSSAPIAPAPNPQIKPAFWASSIGFSGDTSNTGYGYAGPAYVHPLRANLAWVAGASVNYLYYGFTNGAGGQTSVHSPGLNSEAGLRLGDSNWVQFALGPGFKNRSVKAEDGTGIALSTSHDMVTEMNYNAMTYLKPSKVNSVMGIYHYGTADQYTWSSLQFMQQVGNFGWNGRFTPSIGLQGVAEGNSSVHATSVGAVMELLHVSSSTSISGVVGLKHSWSEFGPAQNGPWFGIGLWRRMN